MNCISMPFNDIPLFIDFFFMFKNFYFWIKAFEVSQTLFISNMA